MSVEPRIPVKTVRLVPINQGRTSVPVNLDLQGRTAKVVREVPIRLECVPTHNSTVII